MATISSVWGIRLTLNFYIKGGFSGGEDHRWVEVRTWPGFSRGWEVFNAVFIVLYQLLLILAFSSPAAAAAYSTAPLNALDATAAVLYLLLVAGEALADHQMFLFQREKYRRIRVGESAGVYARGFIERGLWAYSRHPNYFCEVLIWWCYYLFSIASGEGLVNWTLAGPVFLTCLFVLPQASLDVTENLSSRKYPAYTDYQRTVSRFVPLPPKPDRELPPLSLGDRALVMWFVIGTAVTYLIDIEQVLVADVSKYGQAGHTPVWPPAPCVHAIHWWTQWDRLVAARPVWFQAAIWLEVLVQAPYYLIAIEAFLSQRDSIRLPTVVYSTVLLTIMPIIIGEQLCGEHRTHHQCLVLCVYSPYVLMPLLLLARVARPEVFPKPPHASRAVREIEIKDEALPAGNSSLIEPTQTSGSAAREVRARRRAASSRRPR